MTRYAVHEVDADGWTPWINPSVPMQHKIACCDCGLIHDLEFRVENGAVQFRARRNERATAQRRRKRKAA